MTAPTIGDAYPLAAHALALLDEMLAQTPAQLEAWAATATPAAIADRYAAVVAELRRVQDEVVRPLLNRVVEDRFLEQGSNPVERALRAHVRYSADAEARCRVLQADVAPLAAPAAWLRRIQRATAQVAQERAEYERLAHAAREQYEAHRAAAIELRRILDGLFAGRPRALTAPLTRFRAETRHG